jgi:hypothetical protein
MMAATLWPSWILVNNNINKGAIICLSLLPFVRARTRAILRIGPHSKDVLSIIICGMLSQTKNYFSSLSNGGSSPENNPKKKRLTDFEKKQINLPKELQEILIGLLLGDVYAQRRRIRGNTYLYFEQGIVHKNYLYHLFDLFKDYCRSEPRISDRLPDKRTNKVYTRILFSTYSLPCFNVLHSMFYPNGKKIVPLNIEELLTPLGLAYWICDDGTYCKKYKYIRLATNSFTLQEVELLLGVLRSKFNLDCYLVQDRSGYVTTITAKSVLDLQPILKPIMPNSMMHKIGLNPSRECRGL